MRAMFLDANPTLAAVMHRLHRANDPLVVVNLQPDIDPASIPRIMAGAEIAIIDHTALPTTVARQCPGLRHVVFLGTGARSYLNPEELGAIGISVHTIKGYGDTAVAECAIALAWAASKGLARMDREMRAGNWLRTDGVQLTGKAIGLIGFGGIAAEVARLARGIGMRVLAWNRSAKAATGVEFVSLEQLLADSDVISLHLLLNDGTRGFLSAEYTAIARHENTNLPHISIFHPTVEPGPEYSDKIICNQLLKGDPLCCFCPGKSAVTV